MAGIFFIDESQGVSVTIYVELSDGFAAAFGNEDEIELASQGSYVWYEVGNTSSSAPPSEAHQSSHFPIISQSASRNKYPIQRLPALRVRVRGTNILRLKVLVNVRDFGPFSDLVEQARRLSDREFGECGPEQNFDLQGWHLAILIDTAHFYSAGYCLYAFGSGRELWIKQLAIQETLRCQGFGAIFFDWVATETCEGVRLRSRARAVPFYRRIGFQVAEVCRPTGKVVDGLEMLMLPPTMQDVRDKANALVETKVKNKTQRLIEQECQLRRAAECRVLPLWSVVGGECQGGIVVRAGQSLSSQRLPSRLSTGSWLWQVAVEDYDGVCRRLHFRKLTGTGPEEGWASVAMQHKTLLVHASSLLARPLEI